MPPEVASNMSLKRIHREIADLKKEDLGAIVLAPSDDNLFLWKGSIPGPEGSIYEGGIFNFEVNLAPDYPFSAPRVVFKTRIYHMNISQEGNICIDILKNSWSPALSLFKVMLSLSSLLTDPNPKDPLVHSIANQYMRNRKSHDETARQWVELYAWPKPPPSIPYTPSAKAKGKQKATSENVASPGTAAIASSSLEPITINDSDDEKEFPTRKTKRVAKRKRDVAESVMSLTEDNEVEVVDRKVAKKRAIAPSVSSSRVKQLGEVIVLDDD